MYNNFYLNSKQTDSFYELLNLLNYETNFRSIFFPFFFLKNIYYILQKTTARNSFVSIYLFRVSRSISSILSSVFCFTIQSSTSLSSSRLPKLSMLFDVLSSLSYEMVNRKKKKSFVKKKEKRKKD